MQAFCGGIIAKGGRFCTKLNCNYSSHRNKAWGGGKMEPGFYIINQAAQKAYLDPFLPLANGMYSRTGRSVLADGEQTLDAWAAIFCHLRDASMAINKEVATREEDRDYFYEEEDAGLQRFTTAMNTPGRRGGVLNPLESPKRLRLEDSNPNDEASSASQAQPQGPRVTNLKHALALVKGELGMRDADATYNTVHGGLQGCGRASRVWRLGTTSNGRPSVAVRTTWISSRWSPRLLGARATRPCVRWNSWQTLEGNPRSASSSRSWRQCRPRLRSWRPLSRKPQLS
jgi:hypothetical protein